MNESDFERLAPSEQAVLDRSFQPRLSEKRSRNIVLSTLMTAGGVALLALYGVGLFAITAILLVIILVSVVEKVSYSREILEYKSVVRTLVNRIEELEGTELTPLGAHPAARAKLKAERASAQAQLVPP